MSTDALRALVVDDTSLYRKLLSDVLAHMDGVEVVGTANNGTIALAKIAQVRPDVITLDVEMPSMDGLETLRQLHATAPHVGAIMVSSHTTQGARVTMEALELGALDFITKPEGKTLEDNVAALQRQLSPLLKVLRTRQQVKSLLNGQGSVPSPGSKTALAAAPAPRPVADIAQRMHALGQAGRIDLVAMGVSTGGPQALSRVIPQLPAQLGVPVVIVQHMPPVFTAALAESLDRKSALRVVEGHNEPALAANTVYIAPGGKHMKLVRHGAQVGLQITDEAPENHCKPSVDYLLRSVAQEYGHRALGVIMTGMGADGVQGLRLLKQQGATVLAQDEASCVVFGMPMEAIKAGAVDTVLPLEQLATAISQRVSRR